MRKIFFVFLIFLGSLSFITANDFSFSVSPKFNLIYGSSGEFVFSVFGEGKKVNYGPKEEDTVQVSRLDWDIRSLFALGSDFSFQYKMFLMEVGFSVGFPGSSGQMQDYDWIGPGGVLTRYSCHDNDITKYFNGKISAGIKFPFAKDRFELAVLLGFDYQKIAFLSKEGYTQYVPGDAYEWNDKINKKYLDGDVVSYEQNIKIGELASDFTWNATDKFSLGLGADMQLIFAIDAFDEHLRTSMGYYDKIGIGGLSVEGTLFMAYEFFPKNELIFSVSGEYIPVLTGEVHSKNATDKYYSGNPGNYGGSSLWNTKTSLGWRFGF